MEGFPLSSKFGSAFFTVGLTTESDIGSLIGTVERVKFFFHVINMTIVSKPVDLRLLIEEKSGAQSLTEILKSEPFNNIGFNTLTSELNGG